MHVADATNEPKNTAILANDAELNVAQLVHATGWSEATIRRRARVLGGRRGPDGWRFPSVVLEKITERVTFAGSVVPFDRKRRDRGELAALAFPLFAAGGTVEDAVVQFRADPKDALSLFDDWLKCHERSARTMALPPTAAGPAFDHAPNDTHDCCPGHQALRRAEKT